MVTKIYQTIYQALVANKVHNIEVARIAVICFAVAAVIGILCSKDRKHIFFVLTLIFAGLYFIVPGLYASLTNKLVYALLTGLITLILKYGLYVIIGIAGILVLAMIYFSLKDKLSLFSRTKNYYKYTTGSADQFCSQVKVVKFLCKVIIRKVPRNKKEQVKDFFGQLTAYFMQLESQAKALFAMNIEHQLTALRSNMQTAISYNQASRNPEHTHNSMNLLKEYQAQFRDMQFLQQKKRNMELQINNIIAKLNGYYLELQKNKFFGGVPEELLNIRLSEKCC